MLRKFKIGINGKEYIVEMEELTPAPSTMSIAPAPVQAPTSAPPAVQEPVSAPPQPVISGEGLVIEAPMPGTILDIKVKVGDKVSVDQCLVILEAMKMENELVAPRAGTIGAIHTSNKSAINVGEPIITII